MPGGDIPARSTQSVEPRSSLLKLRVCNETRYTTILGQGKKVRRGLGAVAGANIVHWVVEKTLQTYAPFIQVQQRVSIRVIFHEF